MAVEVAVVLAAVDDGNSISSPIMKRGRVTIQTRPPSRSGYKMEVSACHW